MRLEFLLSLFLYFLLLILACLFFSKKIKNLEDFFLASRKLPLVLVYSSIVASWFGATSILVSTDEAYYEGVSAMWVIGIPAILTVLVFGFILARPIRRLPIVSLPDLVEMRYGPLVRHLASVLIIWYMILLASSQMVAIGNFLSSLLGTSYLNGLLLGTGVVLLYSVFGGFFSVALTDGLQFLLLAGGILSLFFFLSTTSSFQEISFLTSQTGQTQFFEFFHNFKENILIVLSFTFAWTISPIVWQRIQAARDERQARNALFLSSGTFIILYGLLVLVGMLSLPLFLSRKLKGPLLSEIISSKTGLLLSCLLFVAIVAAIMSTMDTALNTGALVLTEDIFHKVIKPDASEKQLVLFGRIAVTIMAVCGVVISWRIKDLLWVLWMASDILAAGVFWPLILGLYGKWGTSKGAIASMLVGGGFTLWHYLISLGVTLPYLMPDWPGKTWPFSVFWSIVVGFVVYTVVSLATQSDQEKMKAETFMNRFAQEVKG